jgi:transcriptional regulator with XRE-family HTH domain
MFIFTKEMAESLRRLRINARLSQRELALALGFKTKAGQSYIARLEKGVIKNPTIRILLDYLRTCGESWPEFFKQLDIIDFKLRHEKMIFQLPPQATQRKIQRDAMRYEIGVEFPSKEKEEIDFDRLKKQIKDKVFALLAKNQIGESQSNPYQRYALEYFEFMATLNKAGMKMVADKYQRTGLKLNLLVKIKKIINSVLMGEIKRITAKKPLPTEKQEKMAIGFTRYRIRIERIEAAVHKVLCELGVHSAMGRFALYKDFARECYGILKRYYGKESLGEKLQTITKRWVKEGLEEDVLLKVKEVTIKVFTSKNI